MRREPSIHITKSKLLDIIEDIIGGQKHGIVYPSNIIVDKIFRLSKSHSINTRNVLVNSDRIEKKAKRLINSSRLDADVFAQLVYAIRKKKRHKGISPIKPGGKDWDLVKDITASALNFCEEFGLKKREGFINYIEIGMGKMVKFSLNKFPNMYEGICETYTATQEILKDDNPNGTKELYQYYIQHIADYTGIFEDLINIPEKYVYFIRARKVADEIHVPGVVYIKAQFEGLDFAKGIPHPVQLIGPKALERVNRYTYKRNFKKDYNEVGIPRISLKGV
jgi:hypothetical protein